MITQSEDCIDCHGIPTAVPVHHNPEEAEEEDRPINPILSVGSVPIWPNLSIWSPT